MSAPSKGSPAKRRGGVRYVGGEAAWLVAHKSLTRLIGNCGKATHGRYATGCRCGACRVAHSEYERSKALRLKEGAGGPSAFVDAEPVRRRIEELRSQGRSYAELERLSGIAVTQLRSITVGHWRTGKPVRKVKREVKDAVFGIRGRRRLSERQNVDATWMRGWLFEYASLGITTRRISEITGISAHVLQCVSKGQRSVEARTLHAFLSGKAALDRMARAAREKKADDLAESRRSA